MEFKVLYGFIESTLDCVNKMTKYFSTVSEISCKDPVLFCWWILVHIAPLYWYNDEGEYVFKEKVINHYIYSLLTNTVDEFFFAVTNLLRREQALLCPGFCPELKT